MLDAIARIGQFLTDCSAADFLTDELRQAAVIRQLEIIGEAAARVSDPTAGRFTAVPWRQLKAFRNLLIHEYFRVDAAEVWAAVETDLPHLHEQLVAVLEWLNEEAA